MTESIECPCGSLYLPAGSKYRDSGLSVRLFYDNTEYIDLKLVHNQDVFLSNGQKFITSTEKININQTINIQKIVIYCDDTNINIKNSIQIVIREFFSKEILYNKFFGYLGDSIAFSRNIITNKSSIRIDQPIIDNLRNLYNSKLQLEFYSMCDNFDDQICCDTSSDTITIENIVSGLALECCEPSSVLGACCERGSVYNPVTNEWDAYANCLGFITQEECNPAVGFESERIWISGIPCSGCLEPDFCSKFNLPNSFNIFAIGYGDFAGQETEITITKNDNVYSGNGVWPCGAEFEIGMICNLIDENFSYSGSISCCNQATKWIKDETSHPLLFPNARIPEIIGYTDCSTCGPPCVPTTPTEPTPPPEIPCGDENFGPLTINGYAFYNRTGRKLSIPGIGQINSKCAGGHQCNKTNFIPTLKIGSSSITASEINLNNAQDGGNREATFSFNVPDITLLQNGASVELKCASNQCHNGVTQVVLTCEISGIPIVLFNSCVVPNSTKPLGFSCEGAMVCEEPIAKGLINPSGGYGWTQPPIKTANSITATFKFQDANNCGGGPHYYAQSGVAECLFILSEPKLVNLSVSGNTESLIGTRKVDTSWILVEGPDVPSPTNSSFVILDSDEFGIVYGWPFSYHVGISGQDSGPAGCNMYSKSDSLSMYLGSGEYTVYFFTNTADNINHQNMEHHFNISW